MTTTQRIGFASDSTAVAAAKRRGLFGCTGSGQQCLPVELPGGRGWAFWTAHNYFHADREPGSLVLPGGVEIDLDPMYYDELSRQIEISLADLADWLANELGLTGLRNYLYQEPR